MSLYNALFGTNSMASTLLAALGLAMADVPRFRDCYIEGSEIVIYTRTGGGNRAYYESEESCRDSYPEYFTGSKEFPSGPWNSDLTENPFYLRDEDFDLDATYAQFFFSFPEVYAEDLQALAASNESHTPSEKWRELISTLASTGNQNSGT